jgi:hypothetical protein
MDIRDALFLNTNRDYKNYWGYLYNEFGLKSVLFEFKCYDKTEIGKDEIDQVRNYMKIEEWGRLAIMCCNKAPDETAERRRHHVYCHDNRKIILFITPDNIKEMIDIKERNEDPSEMIYMMAHHFIRKLE